MKTFKTLFYLSLLLLTAFSAASQTIRERYEKAESFLPKNISKLVSNIELRPHWIEESSDFWYVEETPGGSKYMLFDSKKGTSQPAFDQQAIAKLVGEKIDQAVSPDSLHLDDLKFAATKKSIHFRLKDERIFIELAGYTITKTEKIEAKTLAYESVSPDQKWIVSLKDYNLYLKDNETGEELALTTDGIEKYEYANPANNWEKLIDVSKGDSYDPHIDIQWSVDSKKFVTYKIDRRKVGLMYLYQSIPDSGYRAKVLAYERAIPGEDAIMQEFCVFDLEKKKQIKLDIPSVPDICVSFGPQWIDGSDELVLGVYQRGYQSQDLYIANANTGQAKIILHEQAQTMIETQLMTCRWIKNNQEFLYTSERDGWNHIYRYNKDGRLLNQVTEGTFVVTGITAIDEENDQIYFIACGKDSSLDPYYRQFYRIDLDGKNMQLLTPENAYHSISLSADFKTFVDNYSRIDMKPVSVVRSTKAGKVIAQPITANIDALLATGWRFPEPFKTKARDGETDLYGAIYFPSDFNPNKTYPIIDGTYSGPQAVRTPKTFNSAYRSHDVSFAELGFIVITVDGLGTAMRSKRFHDFSYKNLGDIGAEDHIKAIKTLAAGRPYLDPTKVGIYGHSAGGYDACRALLTHPEFYSVGISSAGNHDNRIAKAWWDEQYQGLVGAHYDEQSNFNLADKLEGKLLLIHGDMDNNVNPVSTLRMAGELIRHNRDFDMLIIPNKNHGGVFAVPYFHRKRWDYFVENLLGIDPPKNYELKTY
ncbi:DPP IV N-terminal domain-containing protein [uncultured Sunxiuqinia sp.]|uniref:S9 family peptidase n=1 Tax=uncultured Sunxiuqinia sp. TaxID=1573825 RepID=UPI0030D93148|tara:strand:+ start:51437 stop:53719 length:2283 start_codon:yes stop_codon:yes gene_type:complete